MDEFATAFGDADSLQVLDIYPASEQPIEGITGEALTRRIAEKSAGAPSFPGVGKGGGLVRSISSLEDAEVAPPFSRSLREGGSDRSARQFLRRRRLGSSYLRGPARRHDSDAGRGIRLTTRANAAGKATNRRQHRLDSSPSELKTIPSLRD